MSTDVEQAAARKFSVFLERSVWCEIWQFAEVEVVAESEANARAVVARMIAANHEFDWEDHEILDEDPEPPAIGEIDEFEEEGPEGGGS